MIGANINGKNRPIHTALKDGDTVDVIQSMHPNESLTEVHWLHYCVAKNAKRAICKIIQAKLDKLSNN